MEEDITGKKYGMLTALRLDHIHRQPSGKKRSYWLFKCDCGKEKAIRKNDVIRGAIKSCGCLSEEKDITGKRFGKLVAVKFAYKKGKDIYWLFKCDCGKEKVLCKEYVTGGKTKSCGCLLGTPKHYLSRSPFYKIWVGIKERCFNDNNQAYKNYGGRGITVCDEWKNDFMTFYNWAINNGYKKGLTLDRIDNNGNYCPENCRWATRAEQLRNYRRNRVITYKGETLCLIDMCKKYNVSYNYARCALNAGKGPELVFNNVRKDK